MLGILLGALTIILGCKAFTAAGLPLSKSKRLTGPGAKVVGILCVLLGVAFIADGCFGAAKIIALFSKPRQAAPPIATASIPIPAPDKNETGLEPAAGPEVWERYHTLDRICSAEFPGSPKRAQKKVDVIQLHQMLLQRGPGKGFYALNSISAPRDVSQTLEEAVAILRNAFGAVNDRSIKQGTMDGWQLDFVMSGKISLNRLFVWKGTSYRANVVIDNDAKDDPEVQRFFDSIQFDLEPQSTEGLDTPADATMPSNGTPE